MYFEWGFTQRKFLSTEQIVEKLQALHVQYVVMQPQYLDDIDVICGLTTRSYPTSSVKWSASHDWLIILSLTSTNSSSIGRWPMFQRVGLLADRGQAHPQVVLIVFDGSQAEWPGDSLHQMRSARRSTSLSQLLQHQTGITDCCLRRM